MGANNIDDHFKNMELDQNLPVLMGLLSMWNVSFLGYPARAILPYCQVRGVAKGMGAQWVRAVRDEAAAGTTGTTLPRLAAPRSHRAKWYRWWCGALRAGAVQAGAAHPAGQHGEQRQGRGH